MRGKIKYLICLLLIGCAVAAGVRDFNIRSVLSETEKTLTENYAAEEYKDTDEYKEYETFLKERKINAISAGVVLLIVGGLVLKAGKQKRVYDKLTQEEAAEIAEEINAAYERDNLAVYPDDDEETAEEEEITAPEMPVLAGIELKNRGVVIRWNPVEDADGYIVIRKTEFGNWTRLKILYGEHTLYKDYHLRSMETYVYSVKSFRNNNEGLMKSECDREGLSIFVKDGNMLPPPEVKTVNDKDGRPVLTWTKNIDADYYAVLKMSPAGKWERVKKISAKRAETYTDTQAKTGDICRYSVAAGKIIDGKPVRGIADDIGIEIKY